MGKIKKKIKQLVKSLTRCIHRAASMCVSNRKIVVLGDSHASVFKHPLFFYYFPRLFFHVCSIEGATASGLDNPNSKTQAYQSFNNCMSVIKSDAIIIMLGEVDTGFVIWYRAKKYGETEVKMLDVAIETYTDFIYSIQSKSRLIVISTALPTIEDGNDWGEIANLRKEITVSQKERTDLTILFNEKIEAFCMRNDIDFINLDRLSLGGDGLILNVLKNKNKKNHHYNQVQYAKLLCKNLKQYF